LYDKNLLLKLTRIREEEEEEDCWSANTFSARPKIVQWQQHKAWI